MKKLGLYGCGKLNWIVAKSYKMGLLSDYEIVGCYSKTKESVDELSKFLEIEPCYSYDELLNRKPEYIAEATNPKATKDVLIKTLESKVNVVLLSIGALADEKYYKEVEMIAKKNNVKIHLASGAICGFQVLQTAKLMNLTKAKLTNTKGPRALSRSSLYKPNMEYENEVAFNGSAYEAILNLPTGINVGVATALATMGVHETEILIQTQPGFIGDSQCIDIECGDEIKAHLDVYSRTSDIAGYSVVALLRNLTSSIVF